MYNSYLLLVIYLILALFVDHCVYLVIQVKYALTVSRVIGRCVSVCNIADADMFLSFFSRFEIRMVVSMYMKMSDWKQ